MSYFVTLVASIFAMAAHAAHRVPTPQAAPAPPVVASSPIPSPPQGQADIGAQRRAEECHSSYPGATLEVCEREQQDEANEHAAERGETAPYPTGASGAVEQAEEREAARERRMSP